MKQKYSKQKSGEPAADVQRQCGQKVLEAIESVQRIFAKVLTMCNMPPKFDEALKNIATINKIHVFVAYKFLCIKWRREDLVEDY